MIGRPSSRTQDPSWGAEGPREHDYYSGYLICKTLGRLTRGLILEKSAVCMFTAAISLIDNTQTLVTFFYQDGTDSNIQDF